MDFGKGKADGTGKGIDGSDFFGKGDGIGKGIEGKGIEGKGMEGKGFEGKGIEGKGMEGKGLEGKGFEGKSKGIEGKGLDEMGKGKEGFGKYGGKGKRGGKGKAKLNPSDRTRRRKKVQHSFASYIHKVLKQVHPDAGMSKKAMAIMDSFINDMFDKVAEESFRLVRNTVRKSSTMNAREVQTSARLILPGELSKHAVSEGNKAVTKYNQAMQKMSEVPGAALGFGSKFPA